jgi:FkbM family methyltransferase
MSTLFNSLPLAHRLAFALSWRGVIGSHFYWKAAYSLQSVRSGEFVKLPNGLFLEIDHKDWTSRTLYEGTYERALLKFLSSYRTSGLVIDVGANIGSTLLSMLKKNLDASFLAFEPSSYCFKKLRKATILLKQNGEILQAAVGSSSGTQDLYDADNPIHSGSASLINYKGLTSPVSQVNVLTLDDYIGSLSGIDYKNLSLIKIDTEGFEAEVILGAKKVLSRKEFNVIVIEVSPNFGDISWIENLQSYTGEAYDWYELLEEGFLFKTPRFHQITPNDAKVATSQFNLVLVHKSCNQRL